MATDLRRIDLQQLRSCIARARQMDLTGLTDAQVRARVGRIMDGYLTMRLLLQTNMVFRARTNSADAPFDHSNQLWYPPAHLVSRGRFNAPLQSVFYATNRFQAAVFEIRPNPGDIVTVLVAGSRQPSRPITCAQIGVERCLAPEVVQAGVSIRHHSAMRNLLRDTGFAKRWLAIDRYLGDIATEECPPSEAEHRFKPTNALAEILADIPEFDALHYPSVAAGLRAVNLCLPPERADELFYPIEAWMLRIEDHQPSLEGAPDSEQGYYAVRFLNRSDPIGADGKLVWRPVQNDPMPGYVINNPIY